MKLCVDSRESRGICIRTAWVETRQATITSETRSGACDSHLLLYNYIMNCQQCNNLITGSGKRFCSLRCSNLFRGPTVPKKIYEPKTCKKCNLKFHIDARTCRNVFCSQSCAQSFNNNLRMPRYRAVKCKGCDLLIRHSDVRISGYCTRSCGQKHEIELWLNGIISGNRKYKHADFIRRYLEQISSNSCQRCGENRRHPDGSSILQVNHIDGNWQNNTPPNLELICPTCHALTENYGGRNMGKGRKWKSKYKQY